jgi:hypothetical protein
VCIEEGWEAGEAGLVLCPVAGFGVRQVEPLASVICALAVHLQDASRYYRFCTDCLVSHF